MQNKSSTTTGQGNAPVRTIAQEIASRLVAIANCERSNNTAWMEKHSRVLDLLNAELPSGSGIDCGTQINREKSNGRKIVLQLSYHHMNENGMYDGWTDHTVTVTPAFGGIDISISGRNRNQIKEYLHDTYYFALTASCPARVFYIDKEQDAQVSR